jgi:hypothetical protein
MIINNLPFIMLKCLFFTILIEIVVGLIIGIRNKRDLLIILLVNVFTNPLVTSIPTFIYISWGSTPYIISLILLELFAFVSEGFIYKKVLNYKKINPFIISLILNLSSYLIGLLINNL